MSGERTKNSALTTAQAFHYQVLIGLERCFSLREGQSLWLEKDGDVSLLTPDTSMSAQIEVKNYTAPLTDHHENFWKTLKNWLAPDFDDLKYGALILHTTQAFGAKTRLRKWNAENVEARLKILEDIFGERGSDQINAKSPTEIIKLQTSVLNSDKSLLRNVLGKVVLFTEAEDASTLKDSLFSKLVGIPKSNHECYIESLIGFVYGQANTTSWTVNAKDFFAKCQDLTSLLHRKDFTFPVFSCSEATESQVESYQDRLFVQKIKEIEHFEVISDAVGNWLELQNSLLDQLDGYPLYKDKTIIYQKRLIKAFRREYSSAQLQATDSIKSSKLLYNKTMNEHPLNLDSDTPPIEYKNGLIHDAMDNEDFCLKWRVDLE